MQFSSKNDIYSGMSEKNQFSLVKKLWKLQLDTCYTLIQLLTAGHAPQFRLCLRQRHNTKSSIGLRLLPFSGPYSVAPRYLRKRATFSAILYTPVCVGAYNGEKL